MLFSLEFQPVIIQSWQEFATTENLLNSNLENRLKTTVHIVSRCETSVSMDADNWTTRFDSPITSGALQPKADKAFRRLDLARASFASGHNLPANTFRLVTLTQLSSP